MCINSPAGLPGCFNLDSKFASLDTIAWVFPLYDQVGVTIEIPIFNKCSGVFRKAGGNHVGQYARHNRGPQHIVQSIQAFAHKVGIHIVEKVVNVLNRRIEVLKTKLIWQHSVFVKCGLDDIVTNNGHMLL